MAGHGQRNADETVGDGDMRPIRARFPIQRNSKYIECGIPQKANRGSLVTDHDKISALINWLVAGAPPKRSFNDLVAEIGRRLAGSGIPVHQLGLHQVLIHPELPGRFCYWTQSKGARQASITREQMRQRSVWIGSPAETCMTSSRMVVHNLGAMPEFDGREMARNNARRGYTQFVYTPLQSHYSMRASVASYGSKQAGVYPGGTKYAASDSRPYRAGD